MGLFTKLFGTYSDRELKQIYPVVDRIEAMEPQLPGVEGHVVPEVVEAQLVVGAVGDVGAVGGLPLGLVQAVQDRGHGAPVPGHDRRPAHRQDNGV